MTSAFFECALERIGKATFAIAAGGRDRGDGLEGMDVGRGFAIGAPPPG